jgi:hypothetical protein
MMWVGVIFYSYVISSACSLLNFDARKTELSRKLSLLHELRRRVTMSRLFFIRLQKAIQYDNAYRLRADLTSLVDALPLKLRRQLRHIVNRKMVEANALFEGKSAEFIDEAADILQPYHTQHTEVIYKENEVAVEMYPSTKAKSPS